MWMVYTFSKMIQGFTAHMTKTLLMTYSLICIAKGLLCRNFSFMYMDRDERLYASKNLEL